MTLTRAVLALILAVAVGATGCTLSKDADGTTTDVVIPDIVIPDIGVDVPSQADTVAPPEDVPTSADTPKGGDTADVACDPSPLDPTTVTLPAGDFADPIAVTLSTQYAYVANVQLDAGGEPQQGFVTVVDRSNLGVVSRIAAGFPYPAQILVTDDGGDPYVIVAERGALVVDPGGDGFVPTSPAGLEWIAEADAPSAVVFAQSMELTPLGRAGAPVSFDIEPSGTVFAGSATGGYVMEADGPGCKWLRGAADALDVGGDSAYHSLTVRFDPDDEQLWVLDRETGLVHVYLPATDELDPTSLTGVPYDLGAACAPLDIAFRPTASPDVVVLCGGTAALAAIDTATGTVVADAVALGGLPQAMALNGNLVYVVDIDTDTLRRVDLTTTQVTDVVTLATGAAPTDLAVDSTGEVAWIACPGDDTVIVVDLTTDSTIDTLGATANP